MKYLALLILLFACLAPHAVQAATLSRPTNNLGLAAYWSFDQGTSTKVIDQSGRGHTLTLTTTGSTLPTWSTGRYGKGLTFDGSTNYAWLPVVNDLSFPDQTFTVSFWIKESAAPGTFVMANAAVGGGWGIQDTGGVFLKNVSNSQNNYTISGVTLTDNKWHHMVYVITTSTTVTSNNVVTVYVDGVSVSVSSNQVVTYSPQTNFSIGNRNGNSSFWPGTIDEVRIYGRGLSAVEVQGLYRKGQSSIKNVARTGLVGEWKFDEGVGTTAHNSTNYSTRATLVNGATWTTGKHGRAVQLDGNNQYATIPGSTELNISSVTTAFWFTLTADPECDAGNNYRMLFNKLSGVTGWRVVLEQDKSVQFDVGIGGVSSRSGGRSVGMRVGVPVFLAFTYDAATGDQKIWANGALVYTKANTPAPMDVNSSPFTIGAGGSAGTCPSSGNGFVPGIYDDVRIYNRALSADELYALYKERAVAVNSSQNTKMTNGLIGMWSFNGADVVGTTTVTDGSGNGNNGTIVGTPQRVAGKLGQAFWFTGNQYITTTVAPPSAAYTKTAWVKLTATNCSGSNNIISSSGSATAFWAASSNSCKLAAGHNNSWTQVMDATPLVQKTWYFVSVTYDSTVAGGTLTLYKDGVVVSSATGISAPPNTAAVIGGHNGGNYMVGIIDEARLYNRALSASEIKQLYLMGK